MKKIYKLHIFILAVIIAAAGFVPAAAGCRDAEQVINDIIEYNLHKSSSNSVQEWIDGELTDNAGLGSEWYVIALANYGNYDFSGYTTALNTYLSENDVYSASSRLKYTLAYIACGDETNPYIKKTVEKSISEQGIMSLIFGLHIINNGFQSDLYSSSGLIEELLSMQLDDGGWAISGKYGDIDVTAMTIQALSPYYRRDSSTKNAVDKGLDFLSARQNDDGSYSSFGISNPESISQVIIALSSLGIDFEADGRFIKNGNTVFDGVDRFRLPDGSYCHKNGGESNSTATVQVLSAAIAYKNMKNGKSPFYIFSKNETVCETTTETITAITRTPANTKKPEKNETAAYTVTSAELTSVKVTETAKALSQKNDFILLTVTAIAAVTVIIIALLLKRQKKSSLFVAVILVLAAAVGFALNYSFSARNSDYAGTVTISIRCDTIKGTAKKHIPSNGIVLDETEFEIRKGDTVYDVLAEACKENGIIFSSNTGYVEGINNIFEMDFGDSSGWIYFVNGESPSVGCGRCELSDGDEIQWCYTCDLGKDLDIDFLK